MSTHTIAENLQRLQTARTNIATAITTKGGTVTSGDGFEDFATDIATIPASTTPDWVPDNSVPYIGNGGGSNVWTDGTDIYYSGGGTTTQYVLDKSTSTWSEKTWTGLTNFTASDVWTDGTDIYVSNGGTHYVLDKSTSTWSEKTWTGLTSFAGSNVWTDGTDIYVSNGGTQYVLDKSTSTWSEKTWTGLTTLDARDVWTDGTDIYYSNRWTQYVLNKTTSTWSAKTWTGWGTPSGNSVFTDGTNIYCWFASAYFKYTKVEGNIPKISTRCKPVMPAPTT